MTTRAPMVLIRDPLVGLFSFSVLPIYYTKVNRGMSMKNKHIIRVSAEKEKILHVIQRNKSTNQGMNARPSLLSPLPWFARAKACLSCLSSKH